MRSTRGRALPLCFALGQLADAEAIAALRTAAADDLTVRFGRGPWSTNTTARGVVGAIEARQVIVARLGEEMVGTFTLTAKKPWAIDIAYFSPSSRPLYLLNMAVLPSRQGQGIGRACLAEAKALSSASGADTIRLDAFNAPAGAGGFYAKCRYREVGRVVYRGTPLIYFELMLRA